MNIKILVILLFIAAYSATISQNNLINFQDLNWQEVQIKAQEENKLIFVDIYATWCGSCKKMKKITYSDSTYAQFMNENFVSISYDYERGNGLDFVKNHAVDRWPSLFIMSAKGKVLNKTTGYISPQDLLAITKIIYHINYKPRKDE